MASRGSSAASGALGGAVAGSAFGPIGTAAGGVLGLLAGYFGAGDKDKFVSTLQPEQQQLLGNVLQQVNTQQAPGGNYAQSQDYLSSILGGNPQAYEQFAAPYRTEFEQQTLPRIAERFAGYGGGLGGGVGGSSGFAQALGGAGAQFQSNLSGLFANIRQNAAQQAMNQYGGLLQTGLGNYQAYQQGSPGFGNTFAAGVGQGVGQGVGMGASNRLSNFMYGNKNQNAAPQQGIYDNIPPNSGNGTYNPSTGFQG